MIRNILCWLGLHDRKARHYPYPAEPNAVARCCSHCGYLHNGHLFQ